jgi:hypothetical protein
MAAKKLERVVWLCLVLSILNLSAGVSQGACTAACYHFTCWCIGFDPAPSDGEECHLFDPFHAMVWWTRTRFGGSTTPTGMMYNRYSCETCAGECGKAAAMGLYEECSECANCTFEGMFPRAKCVDDIVV